MSADDGLFFGVKKLRVPESVQGIADEQTIQGTKDPVTQNQYPDGSVHKTFQHACCTKARKKGAF